MSGRLAWARRVGLVIIGLLGGSAVALWLAVRVQLPSSEAPSLPGLASPVEVSFDARAIPTVRANALLDAIRVQGYLVARERFFQMELQRRAARGELAELLGKATLPIDRLHRVYGFRQVAEESLQHLPSDQRAALEAYAAGVNAFLRARPERLGLELALLRTSPRPWTPADSLAVVLLMHEDLSSSWRAELRAESLRGLPEAKRRFLAPRVTSQDLLLVPDAAPQQPDAALLFPVRQRRSRPPVERLKIRPREKRTERLPTDVLGLPLDVLGLPDDAGERPALLGSNNWVLAGSRTKSGKPMLANDPHLALRAPGLWYAIRFELGGRFAQGVSLPGVPGIVIGQNDRLAWGFTNIGTDVQDLYREPATSERVERIAIKGGAEEILKVPLGKHGPQVRPGLSLRWTALDPNNAGAPLEQIMFASDWASFNAAFDGYRGPGQNVVYADADGHIGWRATGLIPIRAPGVDPSLPLDGRNPEHEWRGLVPQAQMPRVLDPPQGYLVTANQRVIGTSFPHHVAALWAAPARARRIEELILRAKDKLGRDELERIQLDDVSSPLRDLMAAARGFAGDHRRFRSSGWSGSSGRTDRYMLPARALQLSLREELHLGLLGDGPERLGWGNDGDTLAALLTGDDDDFKRAGLGDRAAFLERALVRAEAWLARQPGTWGAYNSTQIHHAFGLGGGLPARIFDPPQAEQSGCDTCVRVGNPAHGQSMRMLVDFGDPAATTLVLPLGQSGHLGSPHRLDQRPYWLAGDPGGASTRLVQPPVGAPLRFSP